MGEALGRFKLLTLLNWGIDSLCSLSYIKENPLKQTPVRNGDVLFSSGPDAVPERETIPRDFPLPSHGGNICISGICPRW